jgi:hypothetical protein
MNQKILVFSGKKQSGKTSASNFVHGLIMREKRVFDGPFSISEENGNLIVPTIVYDEENKPVKTGGEMNLQDNSPDFCFFMGHHVWPYIKGYSFADPLK